MNVHTTNNQPPVRVGVIGVGAMGEHHVRVYRQQPSARLVGISDADPERTTAIAEKYGTEAYETEALLEAVDAVSVAVPTPVHADLVERCIDAGVDVLVEKPFVDDIDRGETLANRATQAGVIVQVGHVERFNPAVETMLDIVRDLEVVAVDARRLSPPVERHIADSVVTDLMIHDLDIMLALTETTPTTINASGRSDGEYACAQLTFPDELVCSLTASRMTQRRTRKLDITTTDRQVAVDYLDQSVQMFRQSQPEFNHADGTLKYRNQRVIERPMIESEEPLKRELAAFIEAVNERSRPVVAPEDGLAVLRIAEAIEETAIGPTQQQVSHL